MLDALVVLSPALCVDTSTVTPVKSSVVSLVEQSVAVTVVPSDPTSNVCSVHLRAAKLTAHGVFATEAPIVTEDMPEAGCVHLTENFAPADLLLIVNEVTGVLAVIVISNRSGLFTDWSDRLMIGAAAVPLMPVVAVAVDPVKTDPPPPPPDMATADCAVTRPLAFVVTAQTWVESPHAPEPLFTVASVTALLPFVVASPLNSDCDNVTVPLELSPRSSPVAAAAGTFHPYAVPMDVGANQVNELAGNAGAVPCPRFRNPAAEPPDPVVMPPVNVIVPVRYEHPESLLITVPAVKNAHCVLAGDPLVVTVPGPPPPVPVAQSISPVTGFTVSLQVCPHDTPAHIAISNSSVKIRVVFMCVNSWNC